MDYYLWFVYLLKKIFIVPRLGIRYISYGITYIANILYTNLLAINLQAINLPDLSAILAFLILLCLGTFVYIKLKYPFWSCQPVFHSYDFWRYLYKTPFIIRDGPWQTKYCDFTRIKTHNYLNISSTIKNEIIDLLRCKYIATDRLLYTITESILDTAMIGNSNTSYYSTYIVNEKLRGFMCSRPIQLYFLENAKIYNYSAYYWDYICSDQTHISTDRDISRKLIQTHEYIQRINSPQIKVSLFKKEIDLCSGIRPLTQYKTYSFMITRQRVSRLPHHTHIQQITKTNIHILLDLLEGLSKKDQNNPFTFLGISDLSILLNLIISNQLYCFCLKYKKDILGYYFFKNANIQYEDMAGVNDCDTLHFIASFTNSLAVDLFGLGYLHSIKAILKLKKTFKMLLFDEISHNSLILPSWKIDNPILNETESAYYLYNMCFHCIKPDRVFII